jgi:hypothetical protein
MTTAGKIKVPILVEDKDGKQTMKVVRLDELLTTYALRLDKLEGSVKKLQEKKEEV